MSLSNLVYTIHPSILPLPLIKKSPQPFLHSEQHLFLQDIKQVEKTRACTTDVLSSLAVSMITKNPLPLLLGFSGCLPRAQSQQRIGNEFQINTYTDSSQAYPSVTYLRNGNFVVVWYGEGSGDSSGVFGQLFDNNATKIGNEFHVNTYTSNGQSGSAVESFSNGNFVVTWDSHFQDGSDYGVFGQLFDENTSKVGNEFQINTYTTGSQYGSSIASLNNDNFVVIWLSKGQDGDDFGIFGQLFDENAIKIGNEFQVNTFINGKQLSPAVASFSNGNFVVTWTSNLQDGSDDGVFGQLFAGNASKIGNEFQVNTYTDNDQNRPSVTSLKDNNFVVTWDRNDHNNSNYGIFGQLFDGNARKTGSEFQVNTNTNGRQAVSSVASFFSNDNFVVTWHGAEMLFPGIFGQLFDINGSTMGNEFLINSFREGTSNYAVAAMRNDNFVVVWQNWDQDGSGFGIFGQLFNDVILTTTSSSTSTVPSITSNSTLFLYTSKPSRSILWISLGVGGLICFCVTPLSILLLRKKQSQSGALSFEETGVSPTTFELKPVLQRHKIIGRTYYQLSTLVREEAEEIYLQTGHLIPFPAGQKKFPYVIGSGQFGKIKVAQRIADGLYVASKKVKGSENMRASEAEAQMQQAASGDNVLPIYNTIRLENALYHFMPLAGLGDGSTIQRRLALLKQSPLALTILTFIAQNILTGLQTIHAKGIYHLDIKPDNLVFTKGGTAYITDFGCAKRLKDTCLTGEALGDNRYFSPERLRACKEGTFDAEQADMWAAGIALLQIFYNQDPLELFNLPHRLAARVERCNQAHFDEQLQRLSDVEKGSIWWVIKGLLNTNPKTRFTAKETLQAHCFQGLDPTQQERTFEELRRETFAQQEGIEKSAVNLGDYRWVMQRIPEAERGQSYRSEIHQQFYGYTLTPDFAPSDYQRTPDHVTASSSSSGYRAIP